MKVHLLILACFSFSARVFSQSAEKDWFAFKPSENNQNSVINMQNWLHVPAGRHGFVQSKHDDLVFEDGTPIRFWGVNIASDRPFIERNEAIRWTRFMASYGINAVRFHKFTWNATSDSSSTVIKPDKWKTFDFFNSELKRNGIYYAWSHIYGHRVAPSDSSRLLAYKEVADTKFPWAHINGSTASIVNFAEDLQELNIELTVNMLQHLNPHTGLRYADDPALVCIELQNEDNIFWSAMEATLKQTPTYRALLCRKFSQWLKQKYSSQEALEKAWGAGVLPAGESLVKQNVYPQPNHGFFTSESERAWKNNSSLPQHVVDKAFFMFEEQNKFYQRFSDAIRKTGYKGLIVGSCWQAGSGLAHLLNLYADYNAGVIDRHNYFGGGTGHRLEKGKVNNAAMVSQPGSGLLSTGFQQVADRPFFISEWMSLIPNEWTAESAPIVAAYGMGLQGWDGSFSFAMDYDHFTPTIQSGHGVYNVTSPTHLGLYPALAAMVYRNDISKGAVVADRKVSVGGLRNGRLPLFEKVEQEADVKNLQSMVPIESLAVGRVTLSFVDTIDAASGDLRKAAETAAVLKANNNQLQWHTDGKGYIVLNGSGSQGMIGFAKGKTIETDDIVIETSNEFAVILVTSLVKNRGIREAKRILITTVGRARNTNMKYNKDKTLLEDIGSPPLLLEPIDFTITLKNNARSKMNVLDHSGHHIGKSVKGARNNYNVKGSVHKTLYYELVLEEK